MPLEVGQGQNVGYWDFARFWLCCHGGHRCFIKTCLVFILVYLFVETGGKHCIVYYIYLFILQNELHTFKKTNLEFMTENTAYDAANLEDAHRLVNEEREWEEHPKHGSTYLLLNDVFDVVHWRDCKEIPAYGMMLSICLSVCPSVWHHHFG